MTRIQRTLAVAVAGLAALLLVACSNSAEPAGDDAGTASADASHDHSAHHGDGHAAADDDNSDDGSAGHDHGSGESASGDSDADDAADFANPDPGYCPVSAERIEEPFVVEIDGKRYALCCEHCAKDFRTNPDEYLSDADHSSEHDPDHH